ncbi:MAG: Calx-beta domain-containing protein, partial [bacterium]
MSLSIFNTKAATRANNRKTRRLFSKMDSEMPFLALEIRRLLSGSDPNPPTTWTTQGTWASGYQAEISVKNQQSTWIDGYQFQFDLADNITSIWGGTIVSHTGSRYTVAPDSWASRLNSGAVAKFGFIANGTAGPVAAKVQNPFLSWNLDGGTGTGGGGTIVAGQVSLAYNITNTWTGGFNGEVKVTNTGTSSINGWELKFNTNNTLTNVWNGILGSANTGTISIKNDTWNGTLAPGSSATIGFTANGSATSLPTSFLFNGVAVTPSFNGSQPVVTPSLSSTSLSIVEGQSGTKNLTYTVNLSSASASTVTVQYATSDITATAGSDYLATSGTLSFAPGVTSMQIPVVINGDTDVENDESFKLSFSNPIGATLGTTSVTGLITNDDTAPAPPLPSLVVSSPSITEGNSGTSDLVFNVTLSAAATSEVAVNYATADGTAMAGSDYNATTGILKFAPGETSKPVTVKVVGDTYVENNETFKLLLSGAVGAVITVSTGTGTIVNDDSATPPPATSGKQIVGYFAEWGIYGRNYNIADIPADKLTVVNYAFAQVKNGEVAVYDTYAATDKAFPGDTWDQPLKGNFNQIAKL